MNLTTRITNLEKRCHHEARGWVLIDANDATKGFRITTVEALEIDATILEAPAEGVLGVAVLPDGTKKPVEMLTHDRMVYIEQRHSNDALCLVRQGVVVALSAIPRPPDPEQDAAWDERVEAFYREHSN